MKKILLAAATLMMGVVYSNAQNVNIPDVSFKTYLVGNTAINTNADSEIQVSEAEAYTGAINIGSFSITDLTGIEAFTSLTELICFNNQLTTLDLSANLALTKVRCHNNQLTALILGANTVLNELWCYDNQLSTLDVSANTALTILYCHLNNLATIDVSENNALVEFYCFNNQLTTLDVSPNTSLIKLHCNNNSLTTLKVNNGNNVNFTQLIAQANPDLVCIEVDDDSYSTSNRNGANFIFDIQTSFSENCAASANLNIAELDAVLNVYPNPALSDLTIVTEAIIDRIEVLNMNGTLVQTEKSNTFSLETLAEGMYILTITTDKGSISKRFVKK